jgi:plasmid stabilization system protein ParE
MSRRVRFTREAEDDLVRLYAFLLDRADGDWALPESAITAIKSALKVLEFSPFTCRKVTESPFLRELIIPFGGTGYVALFEIDDEKTVSVLAVRHQREEDYH